MELKETIKKRRSQRSYLDKPVDHVILEKLLGTANLAPSANNSQNRNFIVVTDQKVKQQIFEAGFKQSHLLEAPVVVAFTTNANAFEPKKFLEGCKSWGTDLFGATPENYSANKKFMENWQKWTDFWPIEDVAASIMTLMLLAVDEGLTTCWVGLFDHKAAEIVLKLPKDQKIIALVTLGYSKGFLNPQKRKLIKELIHQEVW